MSPPAAAADVAAIDIDGRRLAALAADGERGAAGSEGLPSEVLLRTGDETVGGVKVTGVVTPLNAAKVICCGRGLLWFAFAAALGDSGVTVHWAPDLRRRSFTPGVVDSEGEGLCAC